MHRTAPSACAGPTDSHGDLLPGSNYTLAESDPDPYDLVSIVCGGTNVIGSTFSVPDSGSVACTITNQIPKGDPGGTTIQTGRAFVFDDINITGIRAGAANANSARVTFTLYSDVACSAASVGTVGPLALTYGSDGTTATASTLGSSGIQIFPGTVYHWQVSYTGDAFNNAFTTNCAIETGQVTFTFTGQGQ